MIDKNLFESNLLWTLIVTYKGADKFYETTFIDFPYEGVNPTDVYDMRACSDDGEMCFYIVFKDDRETLKLYFKHASVTHRLKMFMRYHLLKITWGDK